MRNFVACVVMLAACKGGASDGRPDVHTIDLQTLRVKQLALEAYPQWSMAHPSKECPDSIEPLWEYVSEKATKDAWGNPYKLYCGPNAPAGVRGAGILSFGPDGKEGTADDISSWDGPVTARVAPGQEDMQRDLEKAQAEADQARKEMLEARERVEQIERQGQELTEKTNKAIDSVVDAQNDADRQAATAKLAELQREQAAMQERVKAAKAAAMKAEKP